MEQVTLSHTNQVTLHELGNKDYLKTNGYIVIPCIPSDKVITWRREFRETIANMPEFKNARAMLTDIFNEKKIPFVGGGFGALGNPSSFHNTYVRKLRKVTHTCALREVFTHLLQEDPDLKFEQIIDRMMFRRSGQMASAESWHRDEAKFAQQGDNIYGGWINLDSFNQKFSCVPGTHLNVGMKNGGFVPIPKSEHAGYKKQRQIIEIPPGHMIIFYERMVHEVRSTKLKNDQHRLFLGWRTTKQNTPITQNLDQLLDRQAVIPIKSGQIPPMYPKLYWTNWRDKLLVPWSDKFIEDDLKEVKVLKKTGEKYFIVPREIKKGLLELSMGTSRFCPPYSIEEKQMYHPTRYT